MIETLKTKNEFVYAYIEWFKVKDDGIPSDSGNRVNIYQLWIHPKTRGRLKIIRRFTDIIKSKAPNCTACTWERILKDKKLRYFKRNQLKGGDINGKRTKDRSTAS